MPVLIPFTDDLTAIDQQLQIKIKQAPEFFRHSPIILDVQELNKHHANVNIDECIALLRRLDLLPIGIRGGSPEQNEQALKLHVPKCSALSNNPTQETPVKQPPEKIAPEPEPSTDDYQSYCTTRLVTQPVRSGQRIYAHGDLIVLAQVSAGAEILAEGNIHVYGTLRGRALAGVQGNTEARIFCSDLQAELISIAGNYKISEDLNESVRSKPVQIYLDNLALIIQDL
ncbi:MAG: septum site-determining protein MinC [Methylomicrobium sp.]